MNRSGARDPRTDAAWLTAALREQADEHEADLRRIDARFENLTVQAPARSQAREHGRSRYRDRDRSARLVRITKLRLIGVPLGILAAVATATVAVGVTLGITTQTTHVSGHAAPSSGPSAKTAGQQPSPQTTASAPRPAGTTSTRSQSSPTAPVTATGPVTATATLDAHSTQYWAQENLTVTTTHAIRALHVVINVSGGSSVQSTGWWSTLLAPDLTTTVSPTADGLRYDLTLKPGQILQPAAYGFGFQFNRPAAGHNFALDTYTITATTTDNAAQAYAAGTFST